ncbi:MAG: hypothetical protein WBO71_04880 [Thermoanaerobaculia bacterium]
MNQDFNAPYRVKLVRAEYLLLSDTFNMRNYWKVLEADTEVDVEPAIYESEFQGRRISVHPLAYGPRTVKQP